MFCKSLLTEFRLFECGKTADLIKLVEGNEFEGVRRGNKHKNAEYFYSHPHSGQLHRPGENYNVAPTTF